MKRGLLIVGGLVIVLIIAAVFFLYSSLDSLVKAAVEKYGSEITQTDVRLNEVEIAPTSGKASLRGFKMGNPKPFKTESAFRLGEVSMTLDVSSITKDPIVIKEILIAAPQVTYELSPKGSNLDAIKRNVNAYMGTEQSKGSSKEGGRGGPKLVVENLIIRDGKVNVSATGLTGSTMSASLPNIHLKDIGKKKNGATPGELAEKVIEAITRGTGKAVASLDLGEALGAAKKKAAEAEKALKAGTKDATEKVQKEVEKAEGTLKKLLGD
jgi:hypothetical protein